MLTEFLVLLSSSFLLFYLLFEWKRKNLKLPPGPTVWPVIGNMVQISLADPEYPHIAFMKMAEKYGPLMGLGFGVHYTVIISSYELMKDLCSRPETSERYQLPFTVDRGLGKANMGIVWANGDSWQELRRFAVRKLRDFGFAKKTAMDVIMQEEASSFADHMEKEASKNGGEFLVNSVEFQTSTVNIIWGLVAGLRFHHKDPTIIEAVHLNDDVIHIIGYSNIYSPFPFLKKLFPDWSGYNKHQKSHDKMTEFTKKIIRQIKEKREKDGDREPENLVECFLDEIEKENSGKSDIYTEDQLAIVLNDLFLGGSETTSTTVMWMVMFLAQNPSVQEKVYDEISQFVGSDGNVSLTDDSKMPYTKATIYEVQRFADVMPATGQRIALTPIKSGDYTIPKGTLILFNLHPVLTDKKIWGDPEVFRPERFLENMEDGGWKLIPSKVEKVCVFGFGRRMCMGDTSAMMSIFVFLTTFVKRFRFQTIEGKEPSMIPKPKNFTLIPYNFHVKVESRKTK